MALNEVQDKNYEDFVVRVLSLDSLDLVLEAISTEEIKWSIYKKTPENIYVSCSGSTDSTPIIILPSWSCYNRIYVIIKIKKINGINNVDRFVVSDQFESLIKSCHIKYDNITNTVSVEVSETL